MSPTFSRAETAAYIIKRDRKFEPIIRFAGLPPGRRNGPVDERFGSLIRSITFQLLTTKAAGTIHGRVHELCGDTVNVEAILNVGVDQLRGAGLSRTKAQAMVDLAQRVRDQEVRLAHHGRMSDADILREVTTVRGIGPWTGQMYLMNTLARADVWPQRLEPPAPARRDHQRTGTSRGRREVCRRAIGGGVVLLGGRALSTRGQLASIDARTQPQRLRT
jgi:3-methyladenine DNA glycosylase/8-oxoguanine DNA glycosylase